MSIGNITFGSAMSSIITQGSNGTFRISALLASVAATQMAGELSLRLINGVFHSVGLKPEQNGVVVKMSQYIAQIGLRPYGNEKTVTDADGTKNTVREYSTRDLAIRLIALSVLAIVAFEAATVLCGSTPSIYNNILTFMGPLRVDPRSFLETTGEAIASIRGSLGL
jgi:hypothetical protein